MKLQGLQVGPIVGETTPNRARIWGRGAASIAENLPRRCFGALRHRVRGTQDWARVTTFKMNPNFDMTGIAIVDGLQPETYYEYEVGYYFSDAEISDAGFSTERGIWEFADRGEFQTASANGNRPRTLVVGSCRYLLKTFLGDFFDDRGDKTFRSIMHQINDGEEIHQLIMMGDQIYADDLNVFNPDKTIDQFYRRYRDAFSQKYIRRLMSYVPTYMTLDDHEIEDNWPAKATSKDWKTLFPLAIHAYQAYQLSHSPVIPVSRGRLTEPPRSMWYSYSDGCVDVFVTDSRTERYVGERLSREMLSSKQLSALKRWLNDGSGRIKAVVTSVPFFPDMSDEENDDKWAGFSEQRNSILKHIENNSIKKVVFLSGDVHASFSGQLISPSGIKILSVVSSSFFWPYPHPSERHFKRSGQIEVPEVGHFHLKNSSPLVADDNFTRLKISPSQIQVDVFGRKGNPKSLTQIYDF